MRVFGFLSVFLPVAVIAGCAAGPSPRPGEAGPSAVTENLEVTPGLRPQDVSKALEPVRARLRDCTRLAFPGNGPHVLEVQDGKDDRVLIPFKILSEGTVRADSAWIRSVYLSEGCVRDLLASLRFEPLLVQEVSVTWALTFSTTATERGARRTKLADSYARMCEALSEGLPPGGGPPPEGDQERSRQRLLALIPSLDPLVQLAAEAVAGVNVADRWTIFRASAEEYGLEARCPALEALARP